MFASQREWPEFSVGQLVKTPRGNGTVRSISKSGSIVHVEIGKQILQFAPDALHAAPLSNTAKKKLARVST
jgi:hypothetical protein